MVAGRADVLLARRAAGAAPPRLRAAAGALPRQGGDLCLLYAFPLLLLGDARDQLRRDVARVAGWAFAIWGSVLYWWAGLLYVVQVRALLAAGPPGADAGAPGDGGDRGRRERCAAVKAVVMAGGEGTRLRPMTANQPKPLLPVVNRPIMEHVLRLLRRHGFTETVVTVQFLASLVRNYFGDGDELGMRLQYATEETPARHGRQRQERRGRAARRAVPGHLRRRAHRHRPDRAGRRSTRTRRAGDRRRSSRVPDPLEFGIVIPDEDGRIERFLEKPTWGQVFSDTVNTGIYVMEPEVLDDVPAGESVDWSGDVFPRLLERGAPLYGYVADGYWEDVGTHESYLQAQADVLTGGSRSRSTASRCRPASGSARAPRSTRTPC